MNEETNKSKPINKAPHAHSTNQLIDRKPNKSHAAVLRLMSLAFRCGSCATTARGCTLFTTSAPPAKQRTDGDQRDNSTENASNGITSICFYNVKLCREGKNCEKDSQYSAGHGHLGTEKEGLKALHGSQILHRDLKALNIMIAHDFGVRVADFGLSLFDNASSNALRGIQGTAAYMAPELINGDKYNAKCDIFSLGVIIWEMIYRVVNGHYSKPYSEYKETMNVASSPVLIMQVSSGLRPTIPERAPAILHTLTSSCWHAEPSQRLPIESVYKTVISAESDWNGNAASWRNAMPRQQVALQKRQARKTLTEKEDKVS